MVHHDEKGNYSRRQKNPSVKSGIMTKSSLRKSVHVSSASNTPKTQRLSGTGWREYTLALGFDLLLLGPVNLEIESLLILSRGGEARFLGVLTAEISHFVSS